MMLDDEIVLRNRRFFIRRPWRYLFGSILVITIVMWIVIIMVMLHSLKQPFDLKHIDPFLSSALPSWWHQIRRDPRFYLGIPMFMLIFHFGQGQKVIINQTGILYQTGLPTFLIKMDKSWSRDWKSMRRCQLFLSDSNAQVENAAWVFFREGEALRKLNPLMWREEGAFRGGMPKFEVRRFRNKNREEFLDEVNRTPLMQAVFAKNIAVDIIDELPGRVKRFDLGTNLQCTFIVGIMLLLLTYAAWSFTSIQAMYTSDITIPIIEASCIAVIVAIISFWWLREGTVPLVESIVLTAMVVGSLLFASYYLLRQVNTLTSNIELQQWHYQMTSRGHFESSEHGTFEYKLPSYYWRYINLNEDCIFSVQKGVLGFQQIDLHPVEQAIEAHWDDEEKFSKHDLKASCDFSASPGIEK